MASRAGKQSKYMNIKISEKDLEWKKEPKQKFKFHMTVTHKPTGISIEQASDRDWAECETLCKNSLKWKLADAVLSTIN